MANWLRRSVPTPPNAKGNDKGKAPSVASSIHSSTPFASSSSLDILSSLPGKQLFTHSSASKDHDSSSKSVRRFLKRIKSKESLVEAISAPSNMYLSTSNSSSSLDPAHPNISHHGTPPSFSTNSRSHTPSTHGSPRGSAPGSTAGASPPRSPPLARPKQTGDRTNMHLQTPGRTAIDSPLSFPDQSGHSNTLVTSSESSCSSYLEASTSLVKQNDAADAGTLVRTGAVPISRPTDNIQQSHPYSPSRPRSEVASVVSVVATGVVAAAAAAPSHPSSDSPSLGDFAVSLSPDPQPAAVTPSSPRTISPPIIEPTRTPSPAYDSHPASATASELLVTPLPPTPSNGSLTTPSLPLLSTTLAPIYYGVDAYQLLRNVFNNPLYSDLTLTIGDSQFYVHRGILAQQCAYFQDMFVARRAQDPTAEMRYLDMTHGPVPFTPSATSVAPALLIPHAAHPDETPVETESTQASPEQEASTHSAHDKSRSTTPPCAGDEPESTIPSTPCNEASVPSAKRASNKLQGHLHHPSASTPPPPLPPSAGASWPIDMDTLLKSSLHARHFGIFLALIYGVQTTHQLALEDLLPVLHITHVFRGPSRLLASLAHRLMDRHLHRHAARHAARSSNASRDKQSIPSSAYASHASFSTSSSSYSSSSSSSSSSCHTSPTDDTTTSSSTTITTLITPDSWPVLIRFADYYSLDTLRLWAIERASADRRLWNTAVGCLGLDDYKLFLRGLRNEPARVKNDLLLVFLAYHYQDRAAAVSHGGRAGSSGGGSSGSIGHSHALPSPALSDMDTITSATTIPHPMPGTKHLDQPPSSNSNSSNASITNSVFASSPLSRKDSLTTSNGERGLGHRASTRSSYHHHHRQYNTTHLASSLSPLQQLSRVRSVRSLRMDRVDRAKAWMRRLRVECECDDERAVLD